MFVSVLLENIAPTVSWITSDKSILAVPSKDTPWIVLALAKAVAVEALPVNAPLNVVVVSVLDEGLNVRLVSVSAAWSPVAPSTKTR